MLFLSISIGDVILSVGVVLSNGPTSITFCSSSSSCSMFLGRCESVGVLSSRGIFVGRLVIGTTGFSRSGSRTIAAFGTRI